MNGALRQVAAPSRASDRAGRMQVARMPVAAQWRDQLSTIIAETERNLGIQSRPPPQPLPTVLRAPPARYAPEPSRPPPPPPPMDTQDFGGAAAASHSSSAAGHYYQLAPPPAVDRATTSRLLESVKFEMDVHNSFTAKQLEAVRDEMQTNAQSTQGKLMEMLKGVEGSVAKQIDAEAKLRAHTDTQLGMLRDASATAHGETMRALSEFQQTAI